ncbi:MAG: nuclear transport factor 2 family protein [Myxococcota bacterium]
MADDHEAIRALVHAYAERIDRGDLEGVADLFAHARLVAGDGSAFEGRENLLRVWQSAVRLYEGGDPRCCHLISNLTIEIDPDGIGASATSYVQVMQAAAGFPLQPVAISQHRDRFAKIDGRWRFAERRDRQVLVGDLSRHVKGIEPG